MGEGMFCCILQCFANIEKLRRAFGGTKKSARMMTCIETNHRPSWANFCASCTSAADVMSARLAAERGSWTSLGADKASQSGSGGLSQPRRAVGVEESWGPWVPPLRVVGAAWPQSVGAAWPLAPSVEG